MTTATNFTFTRRALAGLGLGLAATGSARAQDMAGKTIEWIIPFAVGGGSDVWARFHLPLLQKHMPGNPTVVIRNVTGGGSINGANQFAQRTRPDGLTILGTSGSTQFPYLMGDPRVRYDYRAWSVLMASPPGGVPYVRPALGVRGPAVPAELPAAPGANVGEQGPASSVHFRGPYTSVFMSANGPFGPPWSAWFCLCWAHGSNTVGNPLAPTPRHLD